MARMPKSRGKPGPSSVDPASRGSSPAANSGGGPGKTFNQKPIPGPSKPGQPTAMKKALGRKAPRGKGI